MKIAFISGLSDKKLQQKLLPLQRLDQVQSVHLYRRQRFDGEKIHWHRIPVAFAKSRFLGDLWRFLALLVSAWRYDFLIGCHVEYHGVMAWIVGMVWRKPVVQLMINDVDWALSNPLYRRAVMSAHSCGVRGGTGLEQLRAGGYAGPAEIVANPYKLPDTARVDRREIRYDLICVAGCVPQKGHRWLLEVLAEVKKQLPDIRLAIVGAGPFQEHLGDLIDRYTLRDNVHLLGWKEEEELHALYGSSRALVLTSSREGLPMCVVEAMSRSMPVFVTDVGETPWLVRDGVEGRVIDFQDTDALVRAIVSAFQHPERLSEMGAAARARITSLIPHWTVEAITKSWESLLKLPHAPK